MSGETDAVVSYVVGAKGTTGEYERLQDLLKKGYRVLDVRSDAAASGGSSSGSGFVAVTVVLTTAGRQVYREH